MGQETSLSIDVSTHYTRQLGFSKAMLNKEESGERSCNICKHRSMPTTGSANGFGEITSYAYQIKQRSFVTCEKPL